MLNKFEYLLFDFQYENLLPLLKLGVYCVCICYYPSNFINTRAVSVTPKHDHLWWETHVQNSHATANS